MILGENVEVYTYFYPNFAVCLCELGIFILFML